MQDLNDKITGGTLSADEWNEVPTEIQNPIEQTGQALSGGDLNQLGKAIAQYAANGDFYTDSGIADAYVLTTIGTKQAPPAYTDGMQVRFAAGAANTGPSTININGLGVKDITGIGGVVLTGGEIINGGRHSVVYIQSADRFELSVSSPFRTSWVGGDLVVALAAIGSTEAILLVDSSYSVIGDVTVPGNITLSFLRGNKLDIAVTKTLTVEGSIDAGNFEIFTGAGTVSATRGSSSFNIVWFEGSRLNNKWDFLLRGLVSLRPYTVLCPKAEKGMTGVSEVAADLFYWLIDAPLKFDDVANGGQWIQPNSARIRAEVVMAQMILFSETSKIEDFVFPSGVWLDGDAKAVIGIETRGGSRIRADGPVLVTDVEIGVEFNNDTAAVDKTFLTNFYCARFTVAAMSIDCTADAFSNNKFPVIQTEVASNAAASSVIQRGNTRNNHFGQITYQTFTGVDIANVFLLKSSAGGFSSNTTIDSIYGNSGPTTLFKTENDGGSTKAQNTDIGLLGGTDAATIPADLSYDNVTSIRSVATTLDIVTNVGSDNFVNPYKTVSATYDFAVDGGTAGTFLLQATIPNGAIGIRARYEVLTALTSAGAATVRLGIEGDLAGIQAILAFDNAVYTVGLHDGLADGTVANALTKTATDRTAIALVIAGADLTGGKIKIYLDYL